MVLVLIFLRAGLLVLTSPTPKMLSCSISFFHTFYLIFEIVWGFFWNFVNDNIARVFEEFKQKDKHLNFLQHIKIRETQAQPCNLHFSELINLLARSPTD